MEGQPTNGTPAPAPTTIPANGASATTAGPLAAKQLPDELTQGALAAIQAKLRALVDKPLNARTLLEVELTARITKELLIAWSEPLANRPHLAPMGGIFGGGPLQPYGPPEEITSSAQLGPAGAMLPASKQENFGAQIIRELVALRSGKNDSGRSALDTVGAIAFAREKGLDDIAARLEAELFGTTPPAEPKAETKRP